ncbi:MAG: hypothetical protein II872_03065 [Clostridia bacterium]|nr:hypothetical protein [Clostridia bacterium]
MLGLLFPILLLAMGVYVLVGAIRGSGRLFSTDNFKEDCVDKGKKLLRIVYFCLAGVMLIMALSNGLQYALYTNASVNYSVTQAYRDDFKDVLENPKNTDENGMFIYTINEQQSSGMSCFGGTTNVVEKKYGPIDVNSQTLTAEQASVLLTAARDAHPDNFPSTSSSGMSCFGTAKTDDPAKKYYNATPETDANGNQVYISAFRGVRSDATEKSFTKTLYGLFNAKVLEIVNYVCLGLALLGIASIFVISAKFTDKEKAAKARTAYSSGSSMPSGAFNFDDDKKEN